MAVLQVLAVQLPLLNPIFDTTPLSAAQWATCAGVAATVLVMEELIKLARPIVSRAK